MVRIRASSIRRIRPGLFKSYRCRQGGEIFRKRREQCITKACLDYLMLLERAGKILHVQRMNSGGIHTQSKGKQYFIKLCRKGTADIYCRLKAGKTVWIETKRPGEGLEEDQKAFAAKMTAAGDLYFKIESLGALRDLFDKLNAAVT